jgi:hypothetical protein
VTHTRPFNDDEGDFGDWRESARPCGTPACPGPLRYRIWESHDGAYDDYQFRCETCGRTWWVDGIDS